MTDTKLEKLVINELTEEQYAALPDAVKNQKELFLTPDTTEIDLAKKQDKANLVTSLSSESTDAQYPSAKCVYDLLGDVETLLQGI